ncbi:GGDEF domain-containing protein [Thiosulfatimonas sediminis]|uniref:diguanylate cyclase n=1 Tax=Thiosulfatimonas sediminis TaxID=2675054 RepID=A0A6F8PRX9_9GAMM|nr:GGDEF domain-containing protein [Thiosulfatimonas sediminis]BBP44883.1 GGDEF domain-containing protein [Thiosulfatimonas sediminis]
MYRIQDSPKVALRLFQYIKAAFEEQDINPIPLNYYLWYQYYKGDNPQFRQEMDAILKDEMGYSDRIGRRLYNDYFAVDTTTSEFDKALRRLINLMVKKIHVWNEKLDTHSHELEDSTARLKEQNLNIDDVRQITSNVLNTANSMQQTNIEFQQAMLENSQEIQKLRQQLLAVQTESLQDELTEVGNRKALNMAMEQALEEAKEYGTKFCLVITDIDHFKKFNDTYGHLIGDSVLRYFAKVIKRNQGSNEQIFRYGGEEFVLILKNTTLQEAYQRAEDLRNQVSSAHLKLKNSNQEIKMITASFGIAELQPEQDNQDSIFARADKALYQAKREGRNRVITEQDE